MSEREPATNIPTIFEADLVCTECNTLQRIKTRHYNQDETTWYSQDNALQRIKKTHYKGSRQDTMLTKLCSTWCALNVRDEKLQPHIPCKRQHYTHLVDVQHFFQENFADHWRCRLFELVKVSPCNSKRCFFQLWSHPIHVAAPLLRPAGVCGQNWMSVSPRHLSSGPTPSMSPPLTGICGQIYPSTSCGHSSSGPTLSVSPPLAGICVQIYPLTSCGRSSSGPFPIMSPPPCCIQLMSVGRSTCKHHTATSSSSPTQSMSPPPCCVQLASVGRSNCSHHMTTSSLGPIPSARLLPDLLTLHYEKESEIFITIISHCNNILPLFLQRLKGELKSFQKGETKLKHTAEIV